MTFPRRSFLSGIIAITATLGLNYAIKSQITKMNGPHQSIHSPSSKPTMSTEPIPKLQLTSMSTKDHEPGLMLPAKLAMKAEEEDNLIENVVLYLG
ncbi:uncharacterized protein L201_003683 [Kwoniella dendrophila CBS 6074]|uniref:Uncharacterized protein n=1 Tax=Kwoniella dendrophila CBS 6074 TaxID=1295534 RepID=A0AAX4JW85_9TREE